MNYQIRAFQLSLIVHAVAIILLIVVSNPFVPQQKKLLVVDFTLSDSPEPNHGLSVVTGRKKPESKGRKTRIAKQKQKYSVPAPETLPPVKQEAVPVKEQVQTPPVAVEVPTVTHSEKTGVGEDGGENINITRSTSSGRENESSVPSGSGIKWASAGNSAEPGGAVGMGYIKANFSYIRDMIIKRIIYPERAREMGWQGKVKVSFVISSDGLVKDIRIIKSSGVDILDRNAVETVKKASPFPKPPVAAQLIIPISYRLH
jgi:protein TonB